MTIDVTTGADGLLAEAVEQLRGRVRGALSVPGDKGYEQARSVYWEAIHPHSEVGRYVNFMPAATQDRVRDNYRHNYDRLAEIKLRYDPENLFHMNQNIEPALMTK